WRRDRQGSPRDLHVRAHGNRVVQDPDRNRGGAPGYRNQACMRADFAGRRKHGALARREPPLCDKTVFGSRTNPWSDCKALKVRIPAVGQLQRTPGEDFPENRKAYTGGPMIACAAYMTRTKSAQHAWRSPSPERVKYRVRDNETPGNDITYLY